MKSRTRYAIVGTGSRGIMYRDAILKTYREVAELVAVCDVNKTRMAAFLEDNAGRIAAYAAHDFDSMVREQKVDKVIVTSIDRTHHRYICRAMELGCDVITEKPMTTDADKCIEILDTIDKTGKTLCVTFNYRYSPRNSKVRELLASGLIGQVFSVHFEWMLSTTHGADYFRRWHRDKRNGGGLLVHKSTHHFDLVNWWIQSVPESVYALGGLRFYGRENAEERGVTEFYSRASGSEAAASDPFALQLTEGWNKTLYADAEHEDGYYRDQSVFGDGISIEDDLALLVRYRNRATMSYHLTAYSPFEGYRVSFNGSKGRLDFEVVETPYVSASGNDHNFTANVLGSSPFLVNEPTSLIYRPMWGEPQSIAVEETNQGGHGGGDARLLEDVFLGAPDNDPLQRTAGHRDGAWSIATGIAGNRSLQTGLPVCIADMLPQLS